VCEGGGGERWAPSWGRSASVARRKRRCGWRHPVRLATPGMGWRGLRWPAPTCSSLAHARVASRPSPPGPPGPNPGPSPTPPRNPPTSSNAISDRRLQRRDGRGARGRKRQRLQPQDVRGPAAAGHPVTRHAAARRPRCPRPAGGRRAAERRRRRGGGEAAAVASPAVCWWCSLRCNALARRRCLAGAAAPCVAGVWLAGWPGCRRL
jgi:hypothetical protein